MNGTNETSSSQNEKLLAALAESRELINRILDATSATIIGQTHLRKRLLTGLLADGHVLLEGVPGLAKTLAIKTFAQAISASFSRIQFTPDLLPADIIGTEVYRPQEGRFEVRKGPIFANFVLADEINRAPAKVQSALLETMQEHQVTIGGQSFRVPEPFLVLATQNPIEQEGTYPLPEAQVDRFMLKVKVDYPSQEEEKQILERLVTQATSPSSSVTPTASSTTSAVTTLAEIAQVKNTCSQIYVDDRIKEYIVHLVSATRNPEHFKLKLKHYIELGASPRASIALFHAARIEALFHGETFVSPQNVKDAAMDVLRHRLLLSYEASAEGLSSENIIQQILDGIQVP